MITVGLIHYIISCAVAQHTLLVGYSNMGGAQWQSFIVVVRHVENVGCQHIDHIQ